MAGLEWSAMGPVKLELVWARLISAVDEAAKAIVRTSFSTLSNEANDFACVLTDGQARSLAQNTGSIPSFIGTLPNTVRVIRELIPEADMRPGDIYITNNPWIGTGHLNDICLVRPVFHQGRIVAYGATTSHVPDIGGRLRSTEARELFEEGFHIPPMLLLRDGVADATLMRLLRTNIRTPDQTEGDIWAQVSAVTLIGDRVVATLRDHGLQDLDAVAAEIFDRSEAAMVARLREVPEGSWTAAFETDGMAAPFHLAVRVTLGDGRLLADFTGSSPRQPRAVNCPFTYTRAMTWFALKAMLLPDLPSNHGIFRPIRIHVPGGCILNPAEPAPVGGRAATGHYVPVLIFRALAEALPDKVRAAPGSPLWMLSLAGRDASGEAFASTLFFNGGTGAGATQDGADAVSWPSNIAATPVEVAERTAPVLIHRKVLRAGSGGTGRHRGGMGHETEIECEADDIAAVFVTERLKYAAPGLFGGGDGAVGQVLIDGKPADTRTQQTLHRGTRVVMRTPGGGGYG